MVPADAWTHHHGCGSGAKGGKGVAMEGHTKLHINACLAQRARFGFEFWAGLALNHQHRIAEMIKQPSSTNS